MSESSASVSVVPETEIPTWIDACGDEGVTSARKRKLGSGRDEAFSVELAFGALKEKFDACNLACAERAEEKKRLKAEIVKVNADLLSLRWREMNGGEGSDPERLKLLAAEAKEASRKLGEVQREIDDLYAQLFLVDGNVRFGCAAFALSSAAAAAACPPGFCRTPGCAAIGPKIACRGERSAHALCDGCWQDSPLARALCDFVASRKEEMECPFCCETGTVLGREAVKAGMPWGVLRKVA